jgi:putative acetyltransferase
MMQLQIRQDDLSGPEIQQFIRDHLDHMVEVTPSGSVYALDLSGLKLPEVTFWSVWQSDQLVGCGALKEIDSHSGEIKSMRTAAAYRRQGVAAAVLEHIIAEATQRAYRYLYLETGAQPAFAPARALYTRFGFEYCGPFADYSNDPNSVYMTRPL